MSNVILNLLVDSGGSIVRETDKATKLANELERAVRAAKKAAMLTGGSSGGGGLIGGSGGGSGGAGSGGGAGGAGGGGSGGNAEMAGYRQFRGNTGTGADARDFARQAEGLGGLVRVYATFAANIYALSAAFNALSRATDTANMIKGLDQLGAASGRNLSGLTRQLIAASDGAISLKDAMTATAQATSGGLDGAQLIRLTEVAKNASQALGRDMPDALSRLTRGITKIEPELLDELGILVKVDAANVEYARNIGKTASSLTDLERRQAFANAAITQGEEKFKSIQLNSNPYAKVAASMSNLAQSGLTLVNKVLTPLVEVLSSSPTALAVTLAGIAALLVKQAIPALGQWRAGLVAAAAASRETATRINEDFKKFQRDSINRNQPILAQQLASQEAAIAASRTAMNQEAISSGRKLTAGMREVMSTPIAQINQAQLDRLAREETALRNRAARFAQEAVDPQRSAASQASRAAQSADILSRAENTKKYTEQVKAAQVAERALTTDRLRGEQQLMASQTRFGEARQRQLSADRALNAAARAEILSNVGQNTQVMGMAGAYAKLSEETKKARMEAVAAGRSFTGLAAAGTMVRGSFAIATSAVSGFLGAFMPWILIIGLAVAAITLLVEWLGTNNKKIKEFKSSIDNLRSSTELMGNTLNAINKKPFLERLTIETIKARSSALTDLANNVTASFDKLVDADKMASSFDKFIDTWKMLWNGDLRSIATKGLAGAISAALKGATDGASRDKFKESIGEILNNKDTSVEGLMESLDKAKSPAEFLILMEELKTSLDTFAKQTAAAAAPLISFSEALSETGKAANTLIAGLNLTDPMAKLGASVISLSNTMRKLVQEGPINSITALKKLIDTPSESGFLPPEIFSKMLTLKDSVDGVHSSLTTGITDISKYRDELERLGKANIGARRKMSTDGRGAQPLYTAEENSIKLEDSIKNKLKNAEEALSRARSEEKALIDQLAIIQKEAFDYGANAISLAVKNAGAAAALSISKAAAANIRGEGAADVAYRLQIQEIEIQKQVIRGQMDVAKAMFINAQATEKLAAINKLAGIREDLKLAMTSGNPAESYEKSLKLNVQKLAVEATIKTLDAVTNTIKSTKSSADLLKAGKDQSPEVGQALFAYAAPLAGGEAQLTALNAQQKIAFNDKQIKQISEQADKRMKIFETEEKDNALASDKLAKSRENFEISEKQFQADDSALKIAAKTIDNNKINLALETELKILKLAKVQTGEAAEKASLAISNKQLEIAKARAQGAEALAIITKAAVDRAAETQRLEPINSRKTSIDASGAYGVAPEVIQAAQAAMEREELIRKKATASEIADFDVKQKSIEYTAVYTTKVRELGFELDKVNEVQNRTITLADSMSKAFGKVGTVLGTVAKIYSQSAVERVKIEEKLVNDKNKLDKKYQGDQSKISVESVKLDKVAAKDRERVEVDSYANMAGAAKGFFDEKTVAFKTFAIIEQALTLQSMGLQIAALAVDTSTTAGYVANMLVKVGASIKGAIAKALDNVFPYNLVAAGIVVAAASSFGLFSGSGNIPTAPSSEDLQKVQGTGQRYNSKGELESTGYGVLGNDEAKSESIAKSLDLMTQYTFDELEYSNKMLTALENIEKSLSGVSKNLSLTSGLVSGTAFGTVVGEDKKFGGSVFGGNRTTNITGSGIEVSGSVASLASGNATAQQYETGSVTKSGGWFSSDKTSQFKNMTNLSQSVKDSLALSFATIRDGLVEAGSALGLGSKELLDKINSIPVDMSIELRDLKGKELEEAVSAVLSATMDMITEKALEIVKPYQKMGEGLAETAFRLANDSRVIDMQLKSVNMSFGAIGLSSLEARQDLLELAGGLEQFTSDSNYFKDNFLTEAEKLVPVQKAVTDELARLGLSAVDSREEFKQLILSMDLSKEKDQELYTSLMKLQKGFSVLYEASEDVSLSIKDLAEVKMTQMVRVMELLGDKTGVTVTQRIQELKGMDARLRPMQKWIYALEDEAAARETLAEAYTTEAEARQTAIDGLRSSRDTLLDFSKQLALGAQSPLTPGDKYMAAQVNLNEITSILDNKLSTPEETKKALAELPNAITSLLDTSKIFNASSDTFQQDYAYAQRILQSNAANLSTQLTTAELSLAALKSQVDALGGIQSTAININDSIKELTNLMAKSDVAKLLADLSSSGAATAQFIESMNKDSNKTDLQVTAPTDLYIKTLVNSGMAEFTATIAAEMKALKDEVIRLQGVTRATGIEIIYENNKAQEANAATISGTVEDTAQVGAYRNNRLNEMTTYDV